MRGGGTDRHGQRKRDRGDCAWKLQHRIRQKRFKEQKMTTAEVARLQHFLRRQAGAKTDLFCFFVESKQGRVWPPATAGEADCGAPTEKRTACSVTTRCTA